MSLTKLFSMWVSLSVCFAGWLIDWVLPAPLLCDDADEVLVSQLSLLLLWACPCSCLLCLWLSSLWLSSLWLSSLCLSSLCSSSWLCVWSHCGCVLSTSSIAWNSSSIVRSSFSVSSSVSVFLSVSLSVSSSLSLFSVCSDSSSENAFWCLHWYAEKIKTEFSYLCHICSSRATSASLIEALSCWLWAQLFRISIQLSISWSCFSSSFSVSVLCRASQVCCAFIKSLICSWQCLKTFLLRAWKFTVTFAQNISLDRMTQSLTESIQHWASSMRFSQIMWIHWLIGSLEWRLLSMLLVESDVAAWVEICSESLWGSGLMIPEGALAPPISALPWACEGLDWLPWSVSGGCSWAAEKASKLIIALPWTYPLLDILMDRYTRCFDIMIIHRLWRAFFTSFLSILLT